uniref:Pheromone B alpha 1 receptor n=1 Tax=Mycena chlorophos TaxID=658473 RepID=A0ABQ0MFV3_MYCCL|nr:pheromone B alpha 1 receptor [Mycena chlorophos]
MYYYTGAPDWVYTMFAFIGATISFIPLAWHLEAYNVGTCMYMLWTGFACIILGVDSIVWKDNVLDLAPRWCDFSTHFLNGYNLAIPACTLCINRRLYQIASVRTVMKTKAQKRREVIIDLCIALGLPVLQIPLQYIVQGHRYNIYEDIGCLGETYETWVSILIFHLPPIILGCVSAVYCTLSIRAFYASRQQFKELLASANKNLNLNRYFRLMAVAAIDILFTIPLALWVLCADVIPNLGPWISWDNTHSNFSRVAQFPGIEWRSVKLLVASLETTRWATVFCAFIFFAFFGFADEALKHYRNAFSSVTRKMGLSTGTSSTMGSGGVLDSNPKSRFGGVSGAMPSFVRKVSVSVPSSANKHRDSMGSFSSADLESLDYDEKAKTGLFAGDKSFTTDKSFNGAQSFGALTLQDVGGLLPAPDYSSEIGLSPVESSASGSGSASVSLAGDSDAEEVDVSSLHPASIVVRPEPAHVHVPASDIV